MRTTPELSENQLLAALSVRERERLSSALEPVTFAIGDVLYEPGDAVSAAYFPADMIVSLFYVLENGASADISIVGNEGMVGVALATGGDTMPFRALVQSAGHGWRLRARVFREAFERGGEMQRVVLRYLQVLLTQMAQTAVCNRHHSVDQQLCRWLLLSLDRIPSTTLEMTQELIANNLGVRREGITTAARKLQKAGVIDYGRGHITVLDRAALEARSCECYALVRHETGRLLHGAHPRG